MILESKGIYLGPRKQCPAAGGCPVLIPKDWSFCRDHKSCECGGDPNGWKHSESLLHLEYLHKLGGLQSPGAPRY